MLGFEQVLRWLFRPNTTLLLTGIPASGLGTGYGGVLLFNSSFNCRQGRAYLFSNVVNVTVGQQEERLMLSGLHTVEDIYCCSCGQILGWKYIVAHDKNQKFKEGKFVLERWRISEDIAEEFNLEARPGSSDAE